MSQPKTSKNRGWERIIFLLSGAITTFSLWMGKSLFLIILSMSILSIISVFFSLNKKSSISDWIMTLFILGHTYLFFLVSFGTIKIINYSFMGTLFGISLLFYFFHDFLIIKIKKTNELNSLLKFILIYLAIALIIINFFSIIYSSNQDIVYKDDVLGTIYSPFDYFYFSFQKFYYLNNGDFSAMKVSRLITIVELLFSFFFHVATLKKYFFNLEKYELTKNFFSHFQDSNIRAK